MKTIVKKKGKCEIGQRVGFSDMDIRKINTLYNCGDGYKKVGGGVTAKPTVAPTTPKPGCKDNHKWCKSWANTGECKSKHSSWMAVNCPVSCDKCGAACEDRKSICQSWASRGWCDKIPNYMTTYCAKV